MDTCMLHAALAIRDLNLMMILSRANQLLLRILRRGLCLLAPRLGDALSWGIMNKFDLEAFQNAICLPKVLPTPNTKLP